MAAAVLAFDRGHSRPTLVIWRDGRLAAFTWEDEVQEVRRVEARWQDPCGQVWMRVQGSQGQTFLLGQRRGQWWAVPWPPRQQSRSLGRPRVLPQITSTGCSRT
ncbi:MAG: hypothetical protein L6E13_08435 [Firmicutes bacterium]|nr:hypothetical protein [Bacillota bacterium]